MEKVTDEEQALVETICTKLQDLQLPQKYLEPKYLVRFLRARDHNLPKTEIMIRNCFKWRREHNIENILEWTYPHKFKYFWPYYITGFDKWGGPVITSHVGLWDPSKVGKNYDTFMKFIYYEMENIWKLIELRSEGEPAYNQITVIFDLEHLGIRSLTTVEAFGGVLSGIKTGETSYPEIFRAGIVVNAPYIYNMGWKLIKPLLSEHTYSKIKILGYEKEEWTKELLKYADISQFPCKYGGTFPDHCGMNFKNGKITGRYYRSKPD